MTFAAPVDTELPLPPLELVILDVFEQLLLPFDECNDEIPEGLPLPLPEIGE